MDTIRIGNEVFRGGRLLGVWTRGAWHRSEDARTLVPMDPAASSRDAADAAACRTAQPPAQPPPDMVIQAQRRTRELDAILGPRAMKWERAR